MSLSINNTPFWLTLAVWSSFTFILVLIGVKGIFRSPRHRATLILCGMVASVMPFFANRLPEVRDFGIVRQTPFSTAYIPLPIQIPDVSTTGTTSVIGSTPVEWQKYLIGIWWLGAAVGFALLARSILKMNRVVKLNQVKSPMVAGFPLSTILVPQNWPGDLTTEEAEAAMAHERAHLKGFHVAGRIFTETFRSFFWWNPAVIAIARIYEQSLEEIADGEAIRTVRPQDLANALIKVASLGAPPTLATGASTNGKHLETRLARMMEQRKVGHWIPAVGLAAFTLGGTVAAAPRLQSEHDSVAVKPIFGLVHGAKWIYDTTYDGKHEAYELRVAKSIQTKNLTIYELQSSVGKNISYTYQASSKDGLFGIANRTLGGPGYEASIRTPLLVRPYQVGATWKWLAPWRGQTMMGPDGKAPDTTQWDRSCVATIEAQENITVQAGTFRCFRIRIDETSRADGTRSHTDWISLEAGLIKRKNPDQKLDWELVKYVAGV